MLGDFFGTFLTLRVGRPGHTFLRLFGDFGARGCGESCKWGLQSQAKIANIKAFRGPSFPRMEGVCFRKASVWDTKVSSRKGFFHISSEDWECQFRTTCSKLAYREPKKPLSVHLAVHHLRSSFSFCVLVGGKGITKNNRDFHLCQTITSWDGKKKRMNSTLQITNRMSLVI